MIEGKKVKRSNTTGVCYGYIVLDVDGDTVDSNGNQIILSKKDFIGNQEIANIPTVGALLKHCGKLYWLIKETGDTYAILNAETYVEQIKGITEENLMRDLMYYDFDIVKTHKIN